MSGSRAAARGLVVAGEMPCEALADQDFELVVRDPTKVLGLVLEHYIDD